MKAWTEAEMRDWREQHAAESLVLYGAGDLGKIALSALQNAGIRVDAFYDDSLVKQGTSWRGVPIISFGELTQLDERTRIVLSMNYLSVAVPKLEKSGFVDIGNCTQLLNAAEVKKADTGVHPLEIGRKIAWHRRECAKAERDDYLVLKYIDVVITEACSLRCADCANLMQYYSKPRHADAHQLRGDIENLLNAVDWIDEVRVLGGEPLVMRRFAEVIRWIAAHDNLNHIVVYTNATVLPGEAAIAALSDPRVIVSITDYDHLSRKLPELVQLLERNRISHLVKTPSWTDSGRIRPQSKSAAELDAQFERCCVNDILTMLHGRIYRCPFSANLTNLGAAAIEPSEVVEVSPDRQEMRNGLIGLYTRTKHLSACASCSGRDHTTPKIPAAIQASRVLPIPALQAITEKS